MEFINPTVVPFGPSRAPLTGLLALSLAENAYKSGRTESAARYLEIAFAIFDAQATETDEINALPNGD